MRTSGRSTLKGDSSRWYRGKDVPQAAIRRFAQQVAERFQPDKIILFGSHAYGTPHADSDVDILVIMRCRNAFDQAVKIRGAIEVPFAMELIVRTPYDIKRRLKDGDLFHTHIVTKGKILYEKGHAGMDRKGRGRPSRRQPAGARRGALSLLAHGEEPYHDIVCFHCQQSAEKYLKSLLEELNIYVAKTHDLEKLLAELLPTYRELRQQRRGLEFLTGFAIDPRYPGKQHTKRQARAAFRWAGKVRDACRALLGL